jgi:hypothetical protein
VKAEHCLRLDVRALAKRKVLQPGSYSWRWTNTSSGEERGSIGFSVTAWALTLNYSTNGKPVMQHVPLERTACNYGGTRPWLRCPRCDRRVAVLYMRSGLFSCRKCSAVVYASQSEDDIGRAWRRESKLEARLDENWTRPKGMHHATRERIINEIIECEEQRDAALAGFLLRMEARIGKLGGTLGLGIGKV